MGPPRVASPVGSVLDAEDHFSASLPSTALASGFLSRLFSNARSHSRLASLASMSPDRDVRTAQRFSHADHHVDQVNRAHSTACDRHCAWQRGPALAARRSRSHFSIHHKWPANRLLWRSISHAIIVNDSDSYLY
jgi:hypothetical protein